MKLTKKCSNTKNKKTINNKRCSSAGTFYTSSAGAVISLILMLALPVILGVTKTNQVHATASTLTISIVDSIALNITPTSTNGTFATSDTTTNNISVKTTNGTGYELGIKASTNNSNALINSSDSSKTIPSITVSGGIDESTYSTDSTYDNTWGYRPSKLNSAANSNYLQAPTSNSTITTLDKTSSANPSTANTYNLSLGARVDSSIAPGSYSNTFVITVTANPIPYTITYNKNTTDTVTSMPSNVSSQTYDETVNISSTVPERDGYNFKGWCTVQTVDGDTCTGITYNPDGRGTNLAWTLDQTSPSSSLSVYAMWEVDDPCLGKTALYDLVACRSKGKQTNDDNSTTGIKTKPSTTNSGVYEYDSSVFGSASDAASTSAIYYYRGILDSNLIESSYGTNCENVGSCGDGVTHPNYVKLNNNTCWRIVRTTGSGGVKMIYNGMYGDTTAGSCANATTKAQTRYNNADLAVQFNTSSSTKAGKTYTGLQHQNIHAAGYTYSTLAAGTTTATALSSIFGSNSNYSTSNTKSSIMKQYIEDWYASIMTSYTSKLEPSAGYCADRTLYPDGLYATSNLISESTTIIPYSTSSVTEYYFGSYARNSSFAQAPTLGCPRGTVDLYTTSSASNGNKQLTYPVALLTADEMSFAGSGTTSSYEGSGYSYNSYLRSGSRFWSMSPGSRSSDSYVHVFSLTLRGDLEENYVNSSYGVRPVISLTSGTTPASGSGTATDPWIVNP